MTDVQTLLQYRLDQARLTFEEAEKMLSGGFSPRSAVNRAYYAMFYMVLALFIKANVTTTTSKHVGIISIFDKEFVKTGRLSREYSRMLHKMFDRRLEFDYKDYTNPSPDDARAAVSMAQQFLKAISDFIGA
jgi:uncharacterized protein (UPF0332 family)